MSQKSITKSSKNSLQKCDTDSKSSKSTIQVTSSNSPVCRICQTTSNNEILISPCNCKGTLGHIHLSCLERWLNQAGRNYCELCKYRYSAIQTQRYRLWQSIRLWVCHPRNRRHIRSDVIIGVLLSLVTVGLLFICIYGLDYFTAQAAKWGVDKGWVKLFIITFLIVIVLGYLFSMYLLIRDHLVPWYTWYTRTVNIRLTNLCRRSSESDVH